MDPDELAGGRILPVGGRHNVGVARPRQSSVRRLDLLTSGAGWDAEDLVQRGAGSGHVVRAYLVRRRMSSLGRSGGKGERRRESETWRGSS